MQKLSKKLYFLGVLCVINTFPVAARKPSEWLNQLEQQTQKILTAPNEEKFTVINSVINEMEELIETSYHKTFNKSGLYIGVKNQFISRLYKELQQQYDVLNDLTKNAESYEQYKFFDAQKIYTEALSDIRIMRHLLNRSKYDFYTIIPNTKNLYKRINIWEKFVFEAENGSALHNYTALKISVIKFWGKYGNRRAAQAIQEAYDGFHEMFEQLNEDWTKSKHRDFKTRIENVRSIYKTEFDLFFNALVREDFIIKY